MSLVTTFFAGLCLNAFPATQAERNVAVFYQAYFDETGTHDDEFLLVAGFIARDEEWRAFNQDWLALMGSEEAASNFKASTCQDDDLLKRAASIIRNRTACGFIVSISPREYNKIASPRFRSQHGSAYTLCLKETTAKVAQWADAGKMSAPIAYFFDAGHRNQSQAMAYFSRVFSKMPDEKRKIRLGSWTFTDDSLVWPLKAADLLAYSFYKAARYNIKTPAMAVLDEDKTRLIIGTHIDKNDVEGLVEQLRRLYARRPTNRVFGPAT